MPVTVLGRLRKRCRGGKAFKIGDQDISFLRSQGIELVNLGEAGRVKQGQLGHWICSICGAAKSPYAVPTEIAQFLKIHKERCGKDVSHVWRLRSRPKWTCFVFMTWMARLKESTSARRMRTAATRLLDMGLEDLQLSWFHKPDEKLDLLIFDPMPGGSGLLEQMLSRWQELIASAKELLAGCTQGCETACYLP